jgi:hypothetical protein
VDVRLFDLVFLVAFLTAVVAGIVAIVAALRGRRLRAAAIARRLTIGIVAYFVVLIVVAILSPRRSMPLGQAQCSDDWCITPDSAQRIAQPSGVTYEIGFRLSSRARRVAQRERFVVAYLQTADGRRIDALQDSGVPFDTLLQPEQTIRATRRFVVTPSAGAVGLVVAREGGLRFPGCCIIGDESSFFHKHTVVPLD